MDHNLLVSELQSLVVESKRRHPEVKEASEQALELLKNGPLPPNAISQHATELIAPITLGCKTKVGKIIGISIAALQRLVSLKGVPTESLPDVLQTLNSVAGQAVDIQLKLLQTLLSILTHNSDVHDEVLGNALLLCFKLQDSRVSVVSSTAAATLRQAVMIVFDRVSHDSSEPNIPLTLPSDPPTELSVTLSSIDAFNVFSDLCLLTAGGSGGGFSLWGGGKEQKPKLLKLSSLQRTFGLELIESVLSGYEDGVKQRPELLFLLSHSLDPLLIKLLTSKPSFPIALRVCRLQFLLIRSFVEQLPAQVEGYLTTLIRIGTGESEEDQAGQAKKEVNPLWLRVLALEIFRGICGDGLQLKDLWVHFDQPGGPQLFKKIVSALGRLINEKPVLLGIGTQMHGLGVPSTESALHGGYLDMGIGMVATAASVGMSTVGTMMGSTGTGGLGSHSAMKLRLIEQHDKAEAPLIPDTYIYLLALQSLDAVAESIYVAAGQSPEPQDAIRGMAESAWPALLAALSYTIATNLSDNIFAEVLSALQDFTVACGLLNISTPRDAFLSILGKYAVPPPAVAAMQNYMDAPNTPRNNPVINVDSLGLGALGVGASSGPPSLSERNLACLRSMVLTARILASTLGNAWHDVLEVLQNANFMLSAKRPNINRRPTLASPQIGSSPSKHTTAGSDSGESRPDVFEDLDVESIQSAINILFDGSRDLDDEAFTTFINALCRLSSEMIGLGHTPLMSPQVEHDSLIASPSPPLMSPGGEGKRRTSGLNISNSIKSGDRSFSVNKLRLVAVLNLNRLVTSASAVGWDVITTHLLSVARHGTAPTTLRMQASDTLSELLLGAIRIGKESRTQHQVFDVLVRQVDVHPVSNTIATDHDVRSSGYQTLNQILESSGHSLEVGWQTIFGMLNNVTRDKQAAIASTSMAMKRSDSQLSISSVQRPSTFSKSDANLVRIAFPSLSLICTDFLTSLDPASMRQCIACLGGYGRQREDVNITLAAIGLLWNVSDAVQGSDKQLWLYLLLELLELGRDSRLEVRSSAMQTLFRCIDLYGLTLDSALWGDVFWKIISPLLDGDGDESSILALSSTGSIFHNFLPKLAALQSFEKVYARLLERIDSAFRSEARKYCTAALKALQRALEGINAIPDAQKEYVLSSTWATLVALSEHLDRQAYTQDNLVAFVKVASTLHDTWTWDDAGTKQLSSILRRIVTYDASPEYRLDTDSMSPLQAAVLSLVAGSSVLGNTIVLSDLAEFVSLAYVAGGGKVTYVALSKAGMSKLRDAFERAKNDLEIYGNGTVESVVGAFALPIKLKYDCPPANKFGDDPPLWKTALSTFGPILQWLVATLSANDIAKEKVEGIWAQVIDIFGGLLLADNSEESDEDERFILPFLSQISDCISPNLATLPRPLIEQYAEILRKASELYRYDVRHNGGTTAPTIPQTSEKMRYWALDLLVSTSTTSTSHQISVRSEPRLVNGSTDHGSNVARVTLPALMKRIQGALRGFVDDSTLRGQMPLGRVREHELMWILRHLVTMRLYEETLGGPEQVSPQSTSIVASAISSSSRAHLFQLYPILLEIAFSQARLPSMWIFPSEYASLFRSNVTKAPVAFANGVNGDARPSVDGVEPSRGSFDAGDRDDLIEVGARDLARRCLELVGEELGLSS